MTPSIAGSSLVEYGEDTAELTLAYLRERGLLWALVTLFGSFFLAYVNVGTPIPFLADALDDKGVDSTSVGAAYAMHPIGIAFAQLFTAPLERRYGTVKMHSAGFLLAGTCTLLMAFAFDITTDPTMLAVLVIGVRFLQGLGEGVTDNSIISMYQLNFSEVVGKVMGLSEGAIGLGLAVGPLLGGVLYHLGGYRLPLIVVAVPFFVVAGVGPWLMKDFKTRQEDPETASSASDAAEDEPLVNVVVAPENSPTQEGSDIIVCIVSTGILLIMFGYGCVTPLYPIYLKNEFGWNPAVIGLVFASGGVVYFITGLVSGHLSDQNVKKSRPSIYPFLVGPVISGLSYIAAGPFPGLPFNTTEKKVLLLLSVPFASIGQAVTVICGMGVLTVAARSHSLASSAFNASLNLGLGLGPIVGTVLKDQFGFRWAMAVNMFIGLAVTGLLGPLAVYKMEKLNDSKATTPKDPLKLGSLQ